MNKTLSPQDWIQKIALPVWLDRGVHPKGGYYEALSPEGKPLNVSMRAMVQARQIYSFRVGLDMKWIAPGFQAMARKSIESGARFLVEKYSLPSGAFLFSVDEKGNPDNPAVELYTQAFALFGLAHAYAVLKDESLKQRALQLLSYLEKERSHPQGGYTEIKDGKIQFQSNPHMHLFEAALAWMEVDPNPVWKNFAEKIYLLCTQRFIQPQTGLLAEYFDFEWKPLLTEGRFVFEPGHQYEWAWLMGRYGQATGADVSVHRNRLFQQAEKHGIDPIRKVAYDEVWSDFSVKMKTSRFWPQTERIKAASQLRAGTAAQEAMQSLMLYFQTPVAGLWYDRMDETGAFKPEPSKASSLYHIIGAISEFHCHLS